MQGNAPRCVVRAPSARSQHVPGQRLARSSTLKLARHKGSALADHSRRPTHHLHGPGNQKNYILYLKMILQKKQKTFNNMLKKMFRLILVNISCWMTRDTRSRIYFRGAIGTRPCSRARVSPSLQGVPAPPIIGYCSRSHVLVTF